VQGWIKHVRPSLPKESHTQKKVAECVFNWIRGWFFYVESVAEYDLSKSMFYAWLDKQEHILTNATLDTIHRHTIKNLFPYEALWVNYIRLKVLGFGERTTSIGEAMHWSMKSGPNGVRPCMNVDVAGDNMMSKAERLGKNKAVKNAARVSTTMLWSKSETSGHLTAYSEARAANKWDASRRCKVIEVSAGFYWVFTPGKPTDLIKFEIKLDTSLTTVRSMFSYISVLHFGWVKDQSTVDVASHPRYLRVRVCRLVNGGKFATCSCGEPSRMREPCKDLLAVVNVRHPQMYAVRWLALFQHCYKREGHEDITRHFNRMIMDETNRLPDEDVLVEGLLSPSPQDSMFPILHHGTTEADYQVAKTIVGLAQNGTLALRGMPLPKLADPEEDWTMVDNDDEDVDCFGVKVSHSPFAASLLNQGILGTQEIQMDQGILGTQEIQRKAMKILKHKKAHVYSTLCAKISDIARLVEDDAEAVEEVSKKLDAIHLDMIGRFTSISSSPSGGTSFSQTGKSSERKGKRVRGAY